MMSDSGSGVESSPVQNISAQYAKIHRAYQQVLDRWTPFMLYRWLATAGLLSVFMLRIVLAQGVSLYSSLSRATTSLILCWSILQWYIGLFVFSHYFSRQRFSNLTLHRCIQYAVRCDPSF